MSTIVRKWLTEGSAAFADLGTFLPLAIGLIMLGGVSPIGLLYGFGIFALVTALFYRRPIPIQPMKATAAMGIAGLIGPDVLAATGILLGITLILLAQTNTIDWIKSQIPKTVLHGMRAALAITLIVNALGMGNISLMAVALLLALLIGLQYTPLRPVGLLLVLVVGWIVLGQSVEFVESNALIALPALNLPSLASYGSALELSFLPQLALTLTNALILTAVIAQEYFPGDAKPVTEKRLAFTSGIANIVLAPIGAIPMCHGAGGLSAHFAQGSRTGWSIAIFGLVCLLLAALMGPQAVAILAAIPLEVVVVLVLYAAWHLADPVQLKAIKPSKILIVISMTLIALWGGLLASLIFGVALVSISRAQRRFVSN